MTFSEYLRSNAASYVKPTANSNGLNFRTSEGKVVGTILMQEPPTEESEILDWVKSNLNHNVRTSVGSNIISLQAPVDKGFELAGLWDEPAAKSSKKVKA